MHAKWLLATLTALSFAAVQAAPQIQTWRTANGAAVFFVEARELPIVDLHVTFDAAGSRDAGLPGLARLTNGLLAEGAGELSADRIAEGFAGLGVEFGNSSLRDMASVSMRSLSDPAKLQPAAELLSLVLSRQYTAGARQLQSDDPERRQAPGFTPGIQFQCSVPVPVQCIRGTGAILTHQ